MGNTQRPARGLFGSRGRVGVLVASLIVAVTGIVGTAGAQSEDLGTTVTIIHGIPGVTVDLYAADELLVAGFDAGDIQDLTPLAGQTLTDIEARQAGSDEVVIGPIDQFVVPADGNVSVVVHLDAAGSPTITPFPNSMPPTAQGRGLLTIRHAAAAPPIDLMIGDETVLTGVGNGQEAGLELPAGELTDTFLTIAGDRVAALPMFLLEANTQLVVYIGGSLDAGPIEFYQQTIAPPAGEEVAAESAVASGDDDVDGGGGDGGGGEQVAEAAQTGEDADEASVAQTDDGTPQPVRVDTGSGVSRDPSPAGGLVVAGVFALVAALVLAIVRRRPIV